MTSRWPYCCIKNATADMLVNRKKSCRDLTLSYAKKFFFARNLHSCRPCEHTKTIYKP